MKVVRTRTFAFALTFALCVLGMVGAVAAPAMAVGAEVYRTDSQGNDIGAIVNIGDTDPTCCCICHGEGLVGLGVKVCYLPV